MCSRSNRGRLPDSIHVLSSPGHLARRRRITTSAIENFLQSSWPSENGGTGWRELYSLTSFSPTTKTCNTSVMLNGSILVRPGGHCFSPVSSSRSPTGPVQEISRIHAPEESKEEPEGIIPAEIISSPIQWTSPPVASSNPPANPPGCPPDHQYVPRTQRTPLIHSTHTSLGTGHPGVNTTLSLLRDRFWWPNMARDVRRFVQSCPDCAISRSPRHLPASKLHPLPIPNRPWSHLGVDYHRSPCL